MWATVAGRKTTKSAVKPTEAAEVKAIEPKTEEIKTEEKVAEPKSTEEKKAPAKKAAAKTTTTKKAATGTTAKKVEVKSSLHVQCEDRNYTEADLMKIAADVWKYDLKHKASELTSIDLYVKLEESKVYYVMNGEAGSFGI